MDGEQQLRALEEEQAKVSAFGGRFQGDKNLALLKAHEIQRNGDLVIPGGIWYPIFKAAQNRALGGNKHPEIRMQELVDSLREPGRQRWEAAWRRGGGQGQGLFTSPNKNPTLEEIKAREESFEYAQGLKRAPPAGVGSNARSQATETAAGFKARLNTRATRLPETPEQSLAVLRKIHKPMTSAFMVLGAFAVLLDVFDWTGYKEALTATFVGFLVVLAIEFSFFLLIRSLLNRGKGMSMLIMIFVTIAVVVSPIPVLGQLAAPFVLMPVLCLGIFNKNVRVVQTSQEEVQKHTAEISRRIQIAQQTASNILRAGRRVAQLIRATKTVERIGRVERRITKGSTMIKRALGFSGAESVPVLGWIPMNVLSLYFTWRDQKRIYAQSQELLAEYETLRRELGTIDDAIVQAQLAEFTERTRELQTSRTTPRKAAQPQPSRPVVRDINLPNVAPAPA